MVALYGFFGIGHPADQMQKFMLLPLLLLLACEPQETIVTAPSPSPESNNTSNTNPRGNTVLTRFPTPQGYKRVSHAMANFLQQIPLKPEGSAVYLYNGAKKGNQEAHAAVLEYDTGTKDLQQCADAVMRIHAEYLFSQKKFEQIHFRFTNGFEAHYIPWMQGQRLVYQGNSFRWVQKTAVDSSHQSLRSFLDYVYNFAGSLSLSKELVPIQSIENIQPGDVWIIGGSPGHAVTVMDVAINQRGEKIFLLSQGYMPAQDIHILKNPNNPNLSPWYAVTEIEDELYTPEYTFQRSNLKRFPQEK
jgi:hypothetical protein